MTRKQRRWVSLLAALAFLGLALGITLYALSDQIVFFYTPSQLSQKAQLGQHLRLGGMVQEGSVRRQDDQIVHFVIRDKTSQIEVIYQGALPDLFREGQGVVAEGIWVEPHLFKAETVLAKHDERYMPPEVAKALKDQGYWQEKGAP